MMSHPLSDLESRSYRPHQTTLSFLGPTLSATPVSARVQIDRCAGDSQISHAFVPACRVCVFSPMQCTKHTGSRKEAMTKIRGYRILEGRIIAPELDLLLFELNYSADRGKLLKPLKTRVHECIPRSCG